MTTFDRLYARLRAGDSGGLPGAELAPVRELPRLEEPGALAFEQGRYPRGRSSDLHLRDDFAPPGHGDVYASLLGSGMRNRLLEMGVTHVLASNDRRFYGALADFEARFASGPPSLVRAARLVVRGDVGFGRDAAVVGAVELDGPAAIADGTVLRGP